MENLISLVNKLQRACTALGDHGEESALPTLWDSLPAIAVVGGQVLVFPSLARVLGWFLSDLVLPPQLRGADLAGCWWNREDELWGWCSVDLRLLRDQEADFGRLQV